MLQAAPAYEKNRSKPMPKASVGFYLVTGIFCGKRGSRCYLIEKRNYRCRAIFSKTVGRLRCFHLYEQDVYVQLLGIPKTLNLRGTKYIYLIQGEKYVLAEIIFQADNPEQLKTKTPHRTGSNTGYKNSWSKVLSHYGSGWECHGGGPDLGKRH